MTDRDAAGRRLGSPEAWDATAGGQTPGGPLLPARLEAQLRRGRPVVVNVTITVRDDADPGTTLRRRLSVRLRRR
jgi:hypothetical protein